MFKTGELIVLCGHHDLWLRHKPEIDRGGFNVCGVIHTREIGLVLNTVKDVLLQSWVQVLTSRGTIGYIVIKYVKHA